MYAFPSIFENIKDGPFRLTLVFPCSHAGANYSRQLVGPDIDAMSDDDGDVDMDLIATPARTIAQTVTPDTR